jgi:hypothetical protein
MFLPIPKPSPSASPFFDGIGNLRAPRLCLPMEFRPDIRATPAASLAAKPRLQIGQADVIRPSVAADRGLMRAMIIGAVDQKPANARSAHFGKCDFLRAWTVERGHGAIIAPTATGVKPLELGPPPSGHTMTRETNCESQILPRSRLRPRFTLQGIKCVPSLRAKQRSEYRPRRTQQ